MGSGIVAAIGSQFGAPHRHTFAMCGDGGFLMYGNELVTAVKHNVKTTFVVINDSRLNMVHLGMMEQYGRCPDFTHPRVDFAAMAHSMGAEGMSITSRAELESGLRQEVNGPLVLDVAIDPDVRMRANQRVAALREFALEPR
jgi:acetolactate synthase-1/2/3 large subunit